jgi:hypothetical protein
MWKSLGVRRQICIAALILVISTVLNLKNASFFREEYSTFERADKHFKIVVMRNRIWRG